MRSQAARTMLLAQHQQLRELARSCSRFAREYLDSDVGTELDLALEALRDALATHNAAETDMIRALLNPGSPCAALLVVRMLEEHVAEHAVFWEMLSGTRGEVVARIDHLADELEAHMAAEERTFLSPVILDDRVVRTNGVSVLRVR
jgi:iron-sulfur cluster repair protein YtfE (RIC family)